MPFNAESDGTSYTIKANYHKASLSNFVRGGGTEQQPSRCLIVGRVWRSQQNGLVYDPEGLAPTLVVGHHSGVEPKIIEYEENKAYTANR